MRSTISMKHVSQTGSAVAAILLSALMFVLTAVCDDSVAGAAENPFKKYLGTGSDHELEIPDRELTARTGKNQFYSIRYTRWQPASPKGKVLIYNHGLQSHRGWFYPTGNELAESGYVVYAFDRIGSGESSDGMSLKQGEVVHSRGHLRAWELLVETLDQMVRLAGREQPGSDIVVWGNSYGAKVVTAYLFEQAGDLGSRNITAAVLTVPGLYQNKEEMPLVFSKTKLLMASQDALFPVPMVARDNDNGASWFTSLPEWFENIRQDELSIREATRAFWMQTREMDRYIKGQAKRARIGIPALFLMVKDDRMMDNDKMERFIRRRSTDSLFKYFAGGPDRKHFLLYTADRAEAMADILRFLEGNGKGIRNVQQAP